MIGREPEQGLVNPQHKLVLGLVAMSAAALVLTVVVPRPPEKREPAAAQVEEQPAEPAVLEPPRQRAARLPVLRPAGLQPLPRAPDLQAAMQQALPRVNHCAEVHASAMDLDGRVEVEVVIGPTGAESIALLELASLPEAPASCLAAALWGVGWPLVETQQRVSFPFYVVAPLSPAPP